MHTNESKMSSVITQLFSVIYSAENKFPNLTTAAWKQIICILMEHMMRNEANYNVAHFVFC